MTTVGSWLAAHPELERRDREVLLCRAAGLSRAQVLAHPERPLERAVAERLDAWAARRRAGEPVAYIVGRREFWGLELEVGPAVLVPRPETELLVEAALELVAGSQRLLDLGTGSGAVAIALAVEAARRGLDLGIVATDVSEPALAVARTNAARHGVEIDWRRSDWFHDVPERFHLIVSNPPYVPEGDPHLAELGAEPITALVAGCDGLDAIRAIVEGAPAHLEPGSALLLEHGFDQGPAVRVLLEAAGFEAVCTRRDLAGHERVSQGRWPGGSR
ncbi:MAG TPA: peptide chain release factor N(5)-glutamine methyltransferase [Pseudomonadales bacterium]